VVASRPFTFILAASFVTPELIWFPTIRRVRTVAEFCFRVDLGAYSRPKDC
jgi:hypothetical protein